MAEAFSADNMIRTAAAAFGAYLQQRDLCRPKAIILAAWAARAFRPLDIPLLFFERMIREPAR